MDLWVVSFNLSVHSTVPVQQKLFKNCFWGIETFNPLCCKEWYTCWWQGIGCCLNLVRNRCITTSRQNYQGMPIHHRLSLYIVSRTMGVWLPRHSNTWVPDSFLSNAAFILHCVAPVTKCLDSHSNWRSLPYTYSSVARETWMTRAQFQDIKLSMTWDTAAGFRMKAAILFKVLVVCLSEKS